jgi:hypothetical protein
VPEIGLVVAGDAVYNDVHQYIRDFDRLVETTETARELCARVLVLYPDRVNPGMLWWSARTLKPGSKDPGSAASEQPADGATRPGCRTAKLR